MVEHGVPPEVLHLAAGIATQVRSRTPYLDHADLVQEACEWAIRNPRRLAEYMTLPDRDRDAVIATALRNRMRRAAERAKAAYHGYRTQDLVFYSATQLREELLPALFDREAWSSPPRPERGELIGRQDPAHGGNWIASLADVADAYRRLPVEERVIVEMRWRDDLPQKAIARTLDVSETTVSERLDRAVHRMVWHLGGERPVYVNDELPVGSRRAMSNAAAQAATRASYDGE